MREENIGKMNFKELRNEVQLLRDELARMKRSYEDIFYNLDYDNFSAKLVKEKDNMKSEISVTSEAIKTKVSETDLQTALENYSTITQTANSIQSVVSKGANLDEAIKVDTLEDATDEEAIYVIQQTDGKGNLLSETYYYYNDLTKQWEILSGDSIYTVFNQTAEGFSLKGNVLIDGNAVVTKNLKLSGNVTWDMENSPVLTRYSSDNVNWHSNMVSGDMYMQMSFDGGHNWSTSTKVVGTDGSSADVTPENVFNALTDDGAQQGIFAAFVNYNNRIYINAEYLATRIAVVDDALYIGDSDDTTTKKITFSNGAIISTYNDGTGYPYTGISISGSTVKISDILDLSDATVNGLKITFG